MENLRMDEYYGYVYAIAVKIRSFREVILKMVIQKVADAKKVI